MNPLLFRLAAAAVAVTGAALIAWFTHRNRTGNPQTPNYRHQPITQTGNQTDWEPPEDSPSDQCGVCLQELGQNSNGSGRFRLPCKHQLHLQCAKALYQHYIHSSCPICRRQVPREYLRQQDVTGGHPPAKSGNKSLGVPNELYSPGFVVRLVSAAIL